MLEFFCFAHFELSCRLNKRICAFSLVVYDCLLSKKAVVILSIVFFYIFQQGCRDFFFLFLVDFRLAQTSAIYTVNQEQHLRPTEQHATILSARRKKHTAAAGRKMMYNITKVAITFTLLRCLLNLNS